MPDFDRLDALERLFPQLSGIAFKDAHDKLLASGESVAVVENGKVVEIFPSGERIFLHEVKAPIQVQVGTRYIRRFWRSTDASRSHFTGSEVSYESLDVPNRQADT